MSRAVNKYFVCS